MICTRRTTVRIRPELRDLQLEGLQRLSVDELQDLALQIEMETQTLNRLRRAVWQAADANERAAKTLEPKKAGRRQVAFEFARGRQPRTALRSVP